MSDTVIKVENLSKSYLIGHQSQERYTALRDVLANKVKTVGRRLLHPFKNAEGGLIATDEQEEFWALKDVSFEVKRGDRIGIIGRNGAGKSTLLKILSRITEPTSGRIEIEGRVASLLEVGTGFHPELTGRENIFLNGAILGMTRAEIKRKFDEIVDFAEIEKFLDTPVKRYSSGMYVRLAFAVAAHLEAEVLIVDEVLAVGDAEFQKKCLGKMEEVGHEGRTILFVSHNMAAVLRFCNKGIYIDSGSIRVNGTITQTVKNYASKHEGKSDHIIPVQSSTKPQFKSIRLLKTNCNYGECIDVLIELTSPCDADVGVELEIHDERGMPIAYSSTTPMHGYKISISKKHLNRYKISIGPLFLATGYYFLYFWLIKPWAENYHIVKEPLKFSVDLSDPYRTGFDFKQSYARGCFAVPIVSKKIL
jgi:lipopolysaccharide transport system ATP-binding protein